jgi:NADP-dependent aldehyde dehydrogenase
MLVKHPLTAGVGFTGSLAGGRALFDLASNRESPIPVFAEMSSINPIYILPQAMQENGEALATEIAASVNTGAGQFCTCPGLLVALDNSDTDHFIELLKNAFTDYTALTMLNPGIQKNYSEKKADILKASGVATEYATSDNGDGSQKGGPAIASVNASEFLANPCMQDEVFGPFTMMIKCQNPDEMCAVAQSIHGQLTNTIRGTDTELSSAVKLLNIIREKAGRIVFNGVPTGVEVNNAQVHGGPYPSTTDGRFTAVGHSAIRRWVRPIAYQNCPQVLLPAALKDKNVLGIWRTVDGKFENG